MNKVWNTSEVVVGAMVSAVFGMVLMAWSSLYMPLQPVLGPVGIEVLYGLYFLPGILVMYIIRKPGFAILGGLVSAVVELLMGSPFGVVNILLAGLIQGAAAEFIFFIFKYYRFDWLTMIFAGAFVAPVIFVRDFFVFGYGAQPASVLAGMILIRIVSGAILGGFMAKLLGDALARTGVLNNFALGQAFNLTK
ncbi:MAG: ECF transporter S component [Syntrophomonadaceae bacterium]